MTVASLNAMCAEAAVDAFIVAGVREAVISPGSRNTPLVMALRKRAEVGDLKLHTIIDERVAAFFALGLARISGQPALLSCTSGSAATHYFPAIAEASLSRIPLVVVTADRPAELQDCGAPQTTNQQNLFGSHVRGFLHLEAPGDGDLETADLFPLQQLLGQVSMPAPGPVHVNMAFRKPLWSADGSVATPLTSNHLPDFEELRASPHEHVPSTGAFTQLVHSARKATRGLIVWGAGEVGCTGEPYSKGRRRLAAAVSALSSLTEWPVVTDATSGSRDEWQSCHEHIGTADVLFQSVAFSAHVEPDFVLRLGGEPTSKALTLWIRDFTAGRSHVLDPSGWTRDPHRTAVNTVSGDPAASVLRLKDELLVDGPSTEATWLPTWKRADALAKEAIAGTCTTSTLWAGSIAAALTRSLPQGSLLHLASSLAIRSFVSFVPETPLGLTLSSNRGLNGIDGTMATALGQSARWNEGVTAVLLGDVAFVHDASALSYTRRDRPFVIVVVDNDGGGIFDHLPIAEAGPAFEEHFITAPRVNIEALAGAYGLQTTSVHSASELAEAIKLAASTSGSHLVVAKVERERDLQLHRETWAEGRRLVEEGVL